MTDLDELERLERAATPGPWTFSSIEHADGREEAYIEAPGDLFYFRDEAGTYTAKAYDAREPDKAFGRLIVALRNAAPSLIARAREAGRLEAENATLRSRLAVIERERERAAVWQPIETAPEGEKLDVWVPIPDLPGVRCRVTDVYWSADEQSWCDEDGVPLAYPPSHWMRRPAPW